MLFLHFLTPNICSAPPMTRSPPLPSPRELFLPKHQISEKTDFQLSPSWDHWFNLLLLQTKRFTVSTDHEKKKIHKLKVSFYNSRLFSFLFILHLLFVVILCKFYGWAGNPQISLPQPPRLQGFSFLVHFNLRRTQPALDVVFMKCCPALQEL